MESFKLYCSYKRRHYIHFHVHKNIVEMRKACHYTKVPSNCQGLHSSHTKYNSKGNKTLSLGEIHVVAKHLNIEVLTHELAHAAFNYLRALKKDPSDHHGDSNHMHITSGEEVYCYSLGYMVNQAAKHLWK